MDAIETTTTLSPAAAEAAVRASLAEQGFGVITEIDMAATFKAKLGVDRPFLKILGACNPGFAHRAVGLDRDVALLLPCNVVLEEVEGGTRVSAIDPSMLMNDPSFAELAAEVSAKLRAAVSAVG